MYCATLIHPTNQNLQNLPKQEVFDAPDLSGPFMPLTCSQQLVAGGTRLHSFPLPALHLQTPSRGPESAAASGAGCAAGPHLSLVGEAVGADDAFVELDRSFWEARFVLVPEVHKVESEALGEAFVPLEAVQQRPGGVTLHVDAVSNG